MKRMLTLIPVLLILLGALLVFERPAYAYADPGTGLLAVQAVGSALVASGWYLRRKIYALLRRETQEGQEEADQSAAKDSRGTSLS